MLIDIPEFTSALENCDKHMQLIDELEAIGAIDTEVAEADRQWALQNLNEHRQCEGDINLNPVAEDIQPHLRPDNQ